MKNLFLFLLFVIFVSCNPSSTTQGNTAVGQQIPGKIQCERFDTGGEGIAYHDADSINNGSGKLNKINGNPLHEYRFKEGVDISYTKNAGIDNNPYNKVSPDSNQLYVGWTEPGEWINYAIVANATGYYKISLMYTANGDGGIAFDLDGKRLTGDLKISSTHNDQDTIAWRQWHHWNKIDSLTTVRIIKGAHTFKLHVVTHGQMNFDYLQLDNIDFDTKHSN